MQHPQSDDIFRHAGLCSNPLIRNPEEQTRRYSFHAPKRGRGRSIRGNGNATQPKATLLPRKCLMRYRDQHR